MQISLIDNGLDSLKKGYISLKEYEELKENSAEDNLRFFKLKEVILSIQHGVELLFKQLLINHNELLVFDKIDINLKKAYKRLRDNEINYLYEQPGVHMVGFAEAKLRLVEICGLSLNPAFSRQLDKVVNWRNDITHSSIFLHEEEVSTVLAKFKLELDIFLELNLGELYSTAIGKRNLDEAYVLFEKKHGQHDNTIKTVLIQRLIEICKSHNLRNITCPGVIKITNPQQAYQVLFSIVGLDIPLGGDFANNHCSGAIKLENISPSSIISLYAEDNNTYYEFRLKEMLIFIPRIEGNYSPIIFLYSDNLLPIGENPYIDKHGTSVQRMIKTNIVNLLNYS